MYWYYGTKFEFGKRNFSFFAKFVEGVPFALLKNFLAGPLPQAGAAGEARQVNVLKRGFPA
jgi:hypothetical protein